MFANHWRIERSVQTMTSPLDEVESCAPKSSQTVVQAIPRVGNGIGVDERSRHNVRHQNIVQSVHPIHSESPTVGVTDRSGDECAVSGGQHSDKDEEQLK